MDNSIRRQNESNVSTIQKPDGNLQTDKVKSSGSQYTNVPSDEGNILTNIVTNQEHGSGKHKEPVNSGSVNANCDTDVKRECRMENQDGIMPTLAVAEDVSDIGSDSGSDNNTGQLTIPAPPPPPPLPSSLKSTCSIPPTGEYSPPSTHTEEYSQLPGPSKLRFQQAQSSTMDEPSTSGEFLMASRYIPDAPMDPGLNSAVRRMYMYAHQGLLDHNQLNLIRLRLSLLEEYGDYDEEMNPVGIEDVDDLFYRLMADELFDEELLPAIRRDRKGAAFSMFNHGTEFNIECDICLEVKKLYKRHCCEFSACDDCIKEYLEMKINEGILRIMCIGGDCNVSMFRDEISARVSIKVKDKYYKFLVDANRDPKVKTCPNCSHIHELSEEEAEQKSKFGLIVACPKPDCKLSWCFECHAPSHTGIKCKDFYRGDKLVSKWAKEKHYGNINAQKCPRCNIFIERKGGCDHMTCSKCNQSFCYRCGGRYIDLKFFGNHLSRYSPLGCKYNFKPNQPVLRRAVRGSVLGAKILGGIFLLGLGVAAVGVLVGTSVFILPAFGGYKYYKHRKFKRFLKGQQELIKMRSKAAMMEFHRERLATDGEFVDPRLAREHANIRKNQGLGNQELLSREMTVDSERHGDSVHVGIQTGNSQQVDVTVHNPYHEDALNLDEETLNSEIRMNISDEHGHVTVTTAEISHNSTCGDGSEAEIVLHVKTSYPKGEKEPKAGEVRKELKIGDINNSNNVVKIESSEERKKTELDPKLEAQNDSSPSKLGTSHSLDTKSKSSAVHRRAHSTGSLKKPAKKHEFGSLSVKNKKSLMPKDSFDTQTDPYFTLPGSDQGHSGSLLNQTENKPPGDSDKYENEALTQSGCFMKLFGKKLQNPTDKDKHGMLKGPDAIPGDFKDCPDVVSCALESEMNRKDSSSGGEQELDVTMETDQEKFMGLISKESHTTSF